MPDFCSTMEQSKNARPIVGLGESVQDCQPSRFICTTDRLEWALYLTWPDFSQSWAVLALQDVCTLVLHSFSQPHIQFGKKRLNVQTSCKASLNPVVNIHILIG